MLKIAKNETLPLDFLSLRCVVFGGSGAGKTALGRVIFEEGTRAGVPCGVIDLKGDWWGLKSSADGQRAGIPVIVFGGDHGDVPLNENGGAELAEIVAELRQPFIIDLEQFSKGKQLKFLAPFFDRLYDKNRSPLKLICDEADRYIPQRILTKDPNAAICLGAGEDIAKRGRKHGIFPLFISQRNADLNKSVTELCDVAVVFRTSGPNDQKAVEDWFYAKGSLITDSKRAETMLKISGLKNGEAIFCSAHPHLALFKTVQLRMPETFDSSATPEIGKELIQPRKFAPVQLSELNARMQGMIQAAKEKDPGHLRAEIGRLNKEIEKLRTANAERPIPKVEIKMVSVLGDVDRQYITKMMDRFEFLALEMRNNRAKVEKDAEEIAEGLRGLVKRLMAFPAEGQARRPVIDRQHSSFKTTHDGRYVLGVKPKTPLDAERQLRDGPAGAGVVLSRGNGEIGKSGMRRMMIALAQRPGLTRRQLALRAGLRQSGTFDQYLSRMRKAGWMEGNGEFKLTEQGYGDLGEYEPLPEGEELLKYWLGQLGESGAARMLQALAAVYPNKLTREELAVESKMQLSGTFDQYLSRLRGYELVTGRGELQLSAELAG